MYFLSERDGGTFNVYSMQLSDPSKISALTDFKTHPVRFLSRGADGTLAFTYDGEIYTMRQGRQTFESQHLDSSRRERAGRNQRFTSGTRGAVPRPTASRWQSSTTATSS